ncbi:hypothetical protein CN198_14325 [Sinorhizobium meliloti]|uniref:hypothetical protein n=1 Tax=Rhizobium meliloti TaxID=382 RepID=UPI000FDA6094|nr:hypothetical protein [Sinorhizobium meliloti]RVH69231.1 hypothetical protein CN198_14325 [Sinorhizobium meliloti]
MVAVINTIRAVVALAALTVLVGALALNPIFTGWLGGYLWNEQLQSQGLQEAHERYFRTLCPAYFEASLVERWTSPFYFDMVWCEDYKHRL